MKNLNLNEGKVSVRISKNNWMHISKGGMSISVPVNLVKHFLSIPFTKKDGTLKTELDIEADKSRSMSMYEAQIQKLAEDLSSLQPKDLNL